MHPCLPMPPTGPLCLQSKTHGRDAWREFGAFVTCRLGTLVLDAVIMLVGGNLLAAQGAALVERLLVSLGSSFAGGAGVSIIGGVDGPTAIFVSGAGFEDLWGWRSRCSLTWWSSC